MITIKKFYFDPDTIQDNKIEPIFFDKGLNIILGERSDNSEKMNSVGKSLLIEMINYCFLSDGSKRINKIPKKILESDTYICLDFDIRIKSILKKITVKRNRNSEAPIIVIVNGNEQIFEKLSDAKDWLESIIFSGLDTKFKPSLRSLVSILIREEKSSFDDILHPYATKSYLNFSTLVKPHLFLFGIDVTLSQKMDSVFKDISDAESVMKDIRKDFKLMGVDEKRVRSYINDLSDKVEKLNISINELKPGEAIEQKKAELNKLETELSKLITEKASKKLMIDKITNIPEFEKISPDRIKIIYNTFKEGLGDLVKKSLDDVIEFHEKVEEFQNKIFNQRIKDLNKEISVLDRQIDILDTQISKIYKFLDVDKKVFKLKETLKEEREKQHKLSSLSDKYDRLESKIESKKSLINTKNKIVEDLDENINERKEEIIKFENELKELHRIIAGNTSCQFAIKTSFSKEYVVFDYRIDLDGGSGMDRIRTLMYDILLLLSQVTSHNHLGFLIHDNIFPQAGRDDMVQALNFIYEQSQKGKDFQYIVSLNKDEFEAQISKFKFNAAEVTKAVFTRDKPFLLTQYREV